MIAVIPTLGLPALAGTLAQERLEEASSAARIERELVAVEAVDQLRVALTAEIFAGSLTLLSAQLGLPMAMLSSQLGGRFGTQAEARAATDKALAAVPHVEPFTASIARIGREVSKERAAMDEAPADPARSLATVSAVTDRYQRLADQASEVELSLAHHVSIGAAGVTSPALLASTHSFAAISAVTTSAGRRVGAFFNALLSASPAPVHTDVLAWESKRYEVLAAELGTELDQQTMVAWNRMVNDERFRAFDAAVAKGPAAIPRLTAAGDRGALDLAQLAAVIPTARAATFMLTQLSGFLHDAVRSTAVAARAEAAGARQRALLAVAATGLIVVLTMVALFVIGGVLRGRLKELAAGAQRLSAGYLEPVVVHGPRELAATSEALNDAVATLQHVEAKAVILASGDLTSPELEQPAPGPLGAAVHASVSRIVTAVREREELQLQLAHQASHDALTGLPNRAELDRTLQAALDRANRGGTAVSVLFVDLDRFKECNDRFGHAGGDHVLRQTATRLREAIRPEDVVARLGGDEFVIVAEGAPPGPDTVRIGERIVAAVSQPVEFAGLAITIGASVGLAGRARGQATADELLSEADAAAYQAKAAGRGRIVVYDEALRAALHA
jgi:diguanylate cyclase (GGDEF)-like protein